MPNAESLLRTIMGPIRPDIRPLISSVQIADSLIFSQHIISDDILVTKHIYPDVAKMVHKSLSAVSRSVERLSLRCWDSMQEQNLVPFYLGSNLKYYPSTTAMIVCLAVYAHLEIPYPDAIKQYPELMISMPSLDPPPLPSSDEEIRLALRLFHPMHVTQRMVFSTPYGAYSLPVCPSCFVSMEREFQCCCDRCGQHLDWSLYNDAEVLYPGQLSSPS